MSDQKCPDCNGTGTYVGFASSSKCETCGGSGNVASMSVDDEPLTRCSSGSIPGGVKITAPSSGVLCGSMLSGSYAMSVDMARIQDALAMLLGCRVKVQHLNTQPNHAKNCVDIQIECEVFPVMKT